MKKEKRHLIAIVDDEPNSLKAIQRQLMDSYDVVTFTSANKLLDSLHSISPSLFILDWLMPGKDGISLCQEIREMHRFDLVPIVFYSGIDPSEENIQLAYDAGAQAFIPKASFSSFTLMHIRTLIDGFDRMSRYLRNQKTMLSVLKHDMSNMLTGIVTAMNVMMMDKAFRRKGIKQESHMILQACDKLCNLFNDLNEVLANSDQRSHCSSQHIKGPDIRTALEESFQDMMRNVIIQLPDSMEISCDPHTTARAIHYLVKFIDKNVSQSLDIMIESDKCESGVTLTVSIPGDFKDTLETALSNILDLGNYEDRHDLLEVQYFQNYLNQHNTDITILSSGGSTEIIFLVPQWQNNQSGQNIPEPSYSSASEENISVSTF